jgi:hypothetical protein
MQQLRSFQQHIQLPQAAAARFRAGDMFNARQQVGQIFFATPAGRAKDNLVRIFQPKRNDVAVFQFAAVYFFVVDEQPAPGVKAVSDMPERTLP